MEKDNKRVDFDLSLLSLKELTKLYTEISVFKQYLEDSLIKDKEVNTDGK